MEYLSYISFQKNSSYFPMEDKEPISSSIEPTENSFYSLLPFSQNTDDLVNFVDLTKPPPPPPPSFPTSFPTQSHSRSYSHLFVPREYYPHPTPSFPHLIPPPPPPPCPPMYYPERSFQELLSEIRYNHHTIFQLLNELERFPFSLRQRYSFQYSEILTKLRFHNTRLQYLYTFLHR
jgi:hypothetical protein